MSYYSISRIDLYNQCPQKYKFRYIDRMVPPKGEISLHVLVGLSVHGTLEILYRNAMKTKKWPDFSEISKIYDQVWKDEFDKNIVSLGLGDNVQTYQKDGLAILTSYCERQKFEDTTIAVERSFFVTLGEYRFKAIVDRIDYREGDIFLIHDYKTTSRFPEVKNLEQDRQLPLYQMAIKQTYPDVKEVQLTWHFLRFNKSITLQKQDEDLLLIQNSLIEDIRTIELDRNFLPQKSPLCEYCPYQDVCPAFKHRFALEELEDTDLDQGYQAVNELANIQYQIKQHKYEIQKLEEEKKRWEERAGEYALENEITLIEGKTHELSLHATKEIAFPDSKDPARTALESFLKENKLWEKVSILFGPKIKKIVTDASIDKELVQELMGFSYIKEAIITSLKRKKEVVEK